MKKASNPNGPIDIKYLYDYWLSNIATKQCYSFGNKAILFFHQYSCYASSISLNESQCIIHERRGFFTLKRKLPFLWGLGRFTWGHEDIRTSPRLLYSHTRPLTLNYFILATQTNTGIDFALYAKVSMHINSACSKLSKVYLSYKSTDLGNVEREYPGRAIWISQGTLQILTKQQTHLQGQLLPVWWCCEFSFTDKGLFALNIFTLFLYPIA